MYSSDLSCTLLMWSWESFLEYKILWYCWFYTIFSFPFPLKSHISQDNSCVGGSSLLFLFCIINVRRVYFLWICFTIFLQLYSCVIALFKFSSYIVYSITIVSYLLLGTIRKFTLYILDLCSINNVFDWYGASFHCFNQGNSGQGSGNGFAQYTLYYMVLHVSKCLCILSMDFAYDTLPAQVYICGS